MIKGAIASKANIFLLLAVFAAVGVIYGQRLNVNTTAAPVFVYAEAGPMVRAAARPAAARTAPLPEQSPSAPLPIVPPRVLSAVAPEYPAPALEKGIEGVVVVEALIAADGTVSSAVLKSSSGDAELDSAALSSIGMWRFSPALKGGDAVQSIFEVPVRFSIQ